MQELMANKLFPARPRSAGGGTGGIAAKDALGNDVKSAAWLATHGKGDHSLVQGLKASPRSASPARISAGAPLRARGAGERSTHWC